MPTGRHATYSRRASNYKPAKPVAAPRVKLYASERQVVLNVGDLGEIIKALQLLSVARATIAEHDWGKARTDALIAKLAEIKAGPAVPAPVADVDLNAPGIAGAL